MTPGRHGHAAVPAVCQRPTANLQRVRGRSREPVRVAGGQRSAAVASVGCLKKALVMASGLAADPARVATELTAGSGGRW